MYRVDSVHDISYPAGALTLREDYLNVDYSIIRDVIILGIF